MVQALSIVVISSKIIENVCCGALSFITIIDLPHASLIHSTSPQRLLFNPYPTAFPYGNGMVLHFYQQQESSMTKTVHKVINKRLKAYV